MKTILLPTDFSNNSKNAIHYAMQLFSGEHCTFYILHVQKALHYTTDDLMGAPPNTSLYHSITHESKKKLNQLVSNLKTVYPSENYTFYKITDYDVFTDAIKQVVQTKNIDLIIMGTNGATNASEVVFGSNTLTVIRRIDCPLLAIPSDYTFTTPKTILYAMDQDNYGFKNKMSPLLDLIDKYHPTIRILNIIENENAPFTEFNDQKQGKEFFKGCDYYYHSIINVPTAEAITSFVQLMGVDMTAICIKKETFFERFFKGSKTSKISYGTLIPLLIMHPQV